MATRKKNRNLNLNTSDAVDLRNLDQGEFYFCAKLAITSKHSEEIDANRIESNCAGRCAGRGGFRSAKNTTNILGTMANGQSIKN